LLGHYKDSYNAYKRAFEISGNKDNDIHQRLINVKKSHEESIRQKKIELLHDNRERDTVADKLYKNWRDVKVEPNYTGPTLQDNGNVTAEWVVRLM
jgi:hypothetical protein